MPAMPIRWALLDALPPQLAREVASAARHRTFGRGEALFVEGDPAEVVHLIGRGHVGIQVTTPLGDTAMLRVLGPGDHIGEMAILSPGRRSATGLALEPTETLEVHRDQIRQLRTRHPEVDSAFLEIAVQLALADASGADDSAPVWSDISPIARFTTPAAPWQTSL